MFDIVISGISGKFPNAKNVQELSEKLFEKVYLISDSEKRFKLKLPNYPKSAGLLDDLDKCDPASTRTSLMLVRACDPQLRMLSEIVFEAVLDAGYSSEELRSSNIGVYVGCSNYDAYSYWQSHQSLAGMASIANSGYALSNRISYMMDFKGPSLTIDTACSSSFYALNAAYNDIRMGKCDAAIVAGSNMILNPMGMNDGAKGGVLTLDGVSQPFDQNSSGFIRSEAICVVFLQKIDDARRNYATLVNIGTSNDGFKMAGATVPSQTEIQKLLRKTYCEVNMDPRDVTFVESHAASTQVGDKIQVDCIDAVFCEKSREKPLKIGSVKSNTGHTESASGVVSLAKSILMFENEKIIPNINIKQVRRDCDGFVQGRIQVATEVEDFHDDIIGIDNFGILGASSHCIIRRNLKSKENNGMPSDDLPRLLLWSGKTNESVNYVFDNIANQPIDDEFLALLQKTQRVTHSACTQKGFAIFETNKIDRSTKCLDRQIKELTNKEKRPIVFLYSGVGSQWIMMGRDLLRIPLISDVIHECHRILEPMNVNLLNILTLDDPDAFSNCLNIFVSVIAIQIALTDLLKKIGIVADYFIGHSLGELGCAYADGSLTLKQTILAAYVRGKCVIDRCSSTGGMAAVAMQYDDLIKILPSDIEIACLNSSESFTVSGEAEKITSFVQELKQTGVLAKVLDSAGIAFHSSYLLCCGDIVTEKMSELIKEPKKRSEKWISTSVKADHENDIRNSFSSAEYFVNNLFNPVRFSDGMAKLPLNSQVIEIAPHALLQGIVKKSIPDGGYFGLTHRNSECGVVHLLQSIGKISQSGIDLDIREIYPAIEFPVSRGTQMIAPLMKWNHTESHFVPYFDPCEAFEKRQISINLYLPRYSYLSAHVIDGQVIFPAMGYIEHIWETFAMMHGADYQHFSVCFENVKFMRALILSTNKDTDFTISIQKDSGRFEVVEGDGAIVTGRIKRIEDGILSKSSIEKGKETNFYLNREEFYKKFIRLRGYEYLDEFKLVNKIEGFTPSNHITGQIEWRSNWVTFQDALSQFFLIAYDSRELHLPTSFRKIVIDTKTHWEKIKQNHAECEKIGDKIYLNAEINLPRKVYFCGGVQIIEPEGRTVNKRKQISRNAVETFKFVPHFSTLEFSIVDAIKICCQLFDENLPALQQTIVEVDNGQTPIIRGVNDMLLNLQFAAQECFFVTENENIEIKDVKLLKNADDVISQTNFLILQKSVTSDLLKSFSEKIENDCLILWRDIPSPDSFETSANVRLLAELKLQDEIWCIYLKSNAPPVEKSYVVFEIPTDIHDFTWVDDLKEKVRDVNIFYGRSRGNELSGVDAFYKSVVKDYNLKNTQCVFINDESAPEFDVDDPFYADQLKLGLSLNVYQNGSWGSLKHLDYSTKMQPKSYNEHCFVNVCHKGDLNSIHWLNGNLDISQDDVIAVYVGSLNFKDVLIATKRISQDVDSILNSQYNCGLEFSGVDKLGRKVLGIVKNRSLSNFVKRDKYLNFLSHEDWSFEDAATVPIVYFTVYLAFFVHANVEAGESILIHSGTGGLGQAAIHTALNYGLEIFTTVGSDEKKKFIMELFPQLLEENIGNSHDTSFEDMIMDRTNGKGVNYVLNSLIDDKLQASVRCLALNGTFLEVGRYDMEMASNFNMKYFMRQINFRTVYLSHANIDRLPKICRNNLMNKVQDDILSGKIKPLTRTVFNAIDVQKAFRYLSSGKHIGKVLLKIREDTEILPIELKSRTNFNPNKSYIITGGLGGMGLELAEWMIIRDARKLVLSSRRGISNCYQEYKKRLWTTYGVEITISTADISTPSGCEQIIDEASSLGPVGGIFSLAAILENEYFANLTPQTFGNVFPSKVNSAKYLDEITRLKCQEIDHFVVFSSIASGRGAVTQSNYAMANSITERIVERRRRDGLSGKAVQWGPVGGTGMLEDFGRESFHGLELQPVSSCLELMDSFLMSSETVCCSLQYSKKIKVQKHDNFFEIFMQVLGINDWKNIDENCTLSDIGVDSMSGTEIQHILGRDFAVEITLKELRAKKISELKKFLK